MKHCTVLVWWLLALLPAATTAQKLDIAHLEGNFYVFTTYQDYKGTLFPANGMYLLTAEGAVLFDTPWDTTQFQPLLDSIAARHGQQVRQCFATHSHEDRTGGLSYYRSRGVATFTTIKTDSICVATGEPRAEFLMTRDTMFVVGGVAFEVLYPGAGHTPDNVVVWFPSEQLLYGGCLIKSVEAGTLGNLADADVAAWPATMREVQRRCPRPRYIIPGHQRWDSRRAVKHTIKLLKEYQKQQKQPKSGR